MEKETPEVRNEPPKKKRRWFWTFCKYFSLCLLVLILLCAGALVWLTQTTSGQNWLMSSINDILGKDKDKPGLHFTLTSLSGSLPFNFRFGLEAHDQYGLWLSAPDNSFILNWKELPGKIHLSELKVQNADLSRLPDIPEGENKTEPDKPFTLKDFQGLLSDAGGFLYKKPWWLPDIVIEGVGLNKFLLPRDLFDKETDSQARPVLDSDLKLTLLNGEAILQGNVMTSTNNGEKLQMPSFSFQDLQLGLNASVIPTATEDKLTVKCALSLKASQPDLDIKDMPSDLLGKDIDLKLNLLADAITNPDKPSLEVTVEGPDLQAGAVATDAFFNWKSGKEWINGRLDGGQKLRFNVDYTPVDAAWLAEHPESPLAMLPDEVKLNISAEGQLPESSLAIDLATDTVKVSDRHINDIHVLLKSDSLVIPLDENALKALEKEHHADLTMHASTENIPADIKTGIFFQAIENGEKTEWLAGLKQLLIQAGGVNGSGNLRSRIIPDKMPLVDGDLKFNVENWQTINRFLPDMKLDGKLDLNVAMNSGTGQTQPVSNTRPALPPTAKDVQNATVSLDVPSLRLSMGKDTYSITNLNLKAHAHDVYKDLDLALKLNAADIQAMGMKLGLNANVEGKPSGPINASLTSSGNIASKLDAVWKPGEASIRNLNVSMNLPASMSPSGKKANLAIQSRSPMLVTYGESGINVRQLDISIKPSGNLKGHALLAPDKLDCSINLDNFDFGPWQSVIPQLPAGSASLSANLSGSPAKPAGNFQVKVNKVKAPVTGLPPVSLVLKGDIENRGNASALRVNLNIDPATLKALGGTVGTVSASLPLVFGKDGVPKPNMHGNLAARVRWDGALGPLWNLVPLADMRLNGRVNVNIDADGPLSAPRVKGGINISKARFEEIAVGVLLTDINLKVDLKDSLPGVPPPPAGSSFKLPGGAVIAFSASDGRGGTISMDGHSGLTGDGLSINAKINHLKPLRRPDIHVELSGDASVKGSAAAPDIKGEIIINQGEVLLNNIETTGSVTTLPITEPGAKKEQKAEAAAAPKGSGSLDIRIRMLPRFTVEGRGLTSIWQANLLVQGTPTDPRITGNISCVKGNFDFLGKNFALTKGIVFFGGGLVSNPLLDIDLTNETPDLTAHILVTGPVNKMKLSMTSDPSMPRDEILSRVLFGRSVGDLSKMEALQLAGAVAQLAGFGGGTGILGMAKKALGVDVLRLGTSSSNAAGEPGDQTAGGTTIEMGKYINDMIYMGVQQGMQPDSTAFIIQLELTPRTNLEIRTEQNNTWGGLQWKYNY